MSDRPAAEDVAAHARLLASGQPVSLRTNDHRSVPGRTAGSSRLTTQDTNRREQ
jgi:hypothetical protein